MIEKIRSKLAEALQPTEINITDDSPKHASHYTGPTAIPSHLRIAITSSKFNSLTTIARHRLVNEILKEEMQLIHSISLTLQPTEK